MGGITLKSGEIKWINPSIYALFHQRLYIFVFLSLIAYVGCERLEVQHGIAPVPKNIYDGSELTKTDYLRGKAQYIISDGPKESPSRSWNVQAHTNALEQVSFDLFQQASAGHVQQVGPTLSPNAPGWLRLTQRSGSGIWRPPTESHGRSVSWIEGRGGSIDFPITESDLGLEDLLLWLEPVASHQVVSLFIDEILIKNLPLKSKGRFYRLSLPKTLSAGEHTLRLWFRFTRPAPWGGRTAGAVGPIHFLPRGGKPSAPKKWSGQILVEQQRWGALFAPPPTTWRFYITPPHNARFTAQTYVKSKRGVRFQVEIARDTQSDEVLFSRLISPNRLTPINIDLSPYARRPVRLTLKTIESKKTGDTPPSESGSSSEVAWLNPQVLSLHPPPREFPPVHSVIVWSIAGLRGDLIHTSIKKHKSLSTLNQFVSESMYFPTLWSGGTQSHIGHRNFLKPLNTKKSLPQLIEESGGYVSLISSNDEFPKDLIRLFEEVYIIDAEMREMGGVSLMKQVGKQLKLHPEKPHFIYLSTSELRYPFRGARGFKSDERYKKNKRRLLSRGERLRRQYIQQMKLIDYELSLLLSSIAYQGDIKDTVIVLTGSVGQHLGERTAIEGSGVPEEVEVPAVIWHSNESSMIGRGAHGGNVGGLAATLMSILPHVNTSEWPFESFASHLLSSMPLPLHVERASIGGVQMTRLGGLFMYEPPHKSPTLWQLRGGGDPHRDLSDTHSISLRALRDGISASRFRDGL